MKALFLASFARDLKKVRKPGVREKVRSTVLRVEEAPDLGAISGLKKLSGSGPYFRIRVGEYRIGLRVEGDVVTFVRVLPRRDVDRYFP